jgi:MoaA/NifB/PqqE/SkfB family radical SAM enzyme
MAVNKFIPLLYRRLPGQLVIQYTDKCNALCPQCGMRRSNTFTRSTLGQDTTKRIIDHAAQSGIIALSFTGGEPLIYLDHIVELIKYASQAGIKYIRTGTNGFLFQDSDKPGFIQRITEIVQKLTETELYTFWISIDSSDTKVHERMRGLDGVVRGIKKALPVFHKHGLYPAANLGINRHVAEQKDITIEQKQDFYLAFRKGFMY